MVELKNVCFQYAEGGGVVDVNLHAKSGECVVLTGASGCGKSTVTRLINGLAPHFYHGDFKGYLRVADRKSEGIRPEILSPYVGSVFQDPRSQFFNLDTTSEIAFACENMGLPRAETLRRIEETTSLLGIKHLMDKDIFSLSGGEKQLVAIASVLAPDPPILVMDEPSANLDAQATAQLGIIMNKLKGAGKTIIIAEHRLYYLMDIADRFIHMENGRIVHEWSNPEFAHIGTKERETLGLRAASLQPLAPAATKHFPLQENRLNLKNCDFFYRRGKPLLTQVNIEIAPGEAVALIGRNGQGKSTLAKVLCGLKKERSGSLTLGNQQSVFKARPKNCYLVMQEPGYQLFAESVEAEMRLSSRETDDDSVSGMLDTLGLSGYGERHPMSLSGGQKQRLSIGVAIMQDTDTIIMDEPTSGLDYRSMTCICRLIEQLRIQGKKILIITHDYEFVLKACTRVLHLENGTISRDYALNNKNLSKLRAFFLPEGKEDFYESKQISK